MDICTVDWATGRIVEIGDEPWPPPAPVPPMMPLGLRHWAVLAVLLAAVAAAGVQTLRLAQLRAAVATEAAERADLAREGQVQARRAQDSINTNARRSTDVYLARAQAARAAAAGTDAAYLGLLDAIAAGGGTADDPAARCRAAAERVGILERLLGEGAGLAAEGARRVGALEAKLSGLQEHAGVGQLPVK